MITYQRLRSVDSGRHADHVGREDLIEDVESHDARDDDDADHHDAAVPELRSRLDHLRQAELGALCRVERGEDGSDGYAREDRQHRGREIRTQGRTHHAGRKSGEIRVGDEPEREQR